MIGLLGINIYGWSKAGVNHKLIFELDPRDHLTFIDLLKVREDFPLLKPYVKYLNQQRIYLFLGFFSKKLLEELS